MKKRKGGITAPVQTWCKDNTTYLKYQVLSVLKLEKITAKALNDRLGFNDARKIISVLRSEGYRISDYLLNDRRKVYYLVPDSQLSLFDFEKGGAL